MSGDHVIGAAKTDLVSVGRLNKERERKEENQEFHNEAMVARIQEKQHDY
jgi:hypothetical protein